MQSKDSKKIKLNKKEQNRANQREAERKELELNYSYITTAHDLDKDWLIYLMLGFNKNGVGYEQVKGKLIEFVKLLEMYREYQQARCNAVSPRDKEAFAIWQSTLEEFPPAFKEDVHQWMAKYFTVSNDFQLDRVLEENWKGICNIESLHILSYYVRKICKQLGKKYLPTFKLKTLKALGDKYCRINE